MRKMFRAVGLLMAGFICCVSAKGQSVCANPSNVNTLYCTPILAVDNLHFVGSSLSVVPSVPPAFSALNADIGSQISQVPTPSPAGGIVFSFGPGGLTTQRDLGPIFSDSATTIGKHKLYLAFSYQFFEFDQIDSTALKQIPLQISGCDPMVSGCGKPPIVTKSDLSLKSNQYTTYVTFGLLGWLDVSAVIPIVNVRMGMQTTCSICFQSQPTPGVTLVFTPNTATANATGIGDVRFRVKAALIQGERTSLAVGWDVRTPTGNDLNFLGTGTVGFRPFASFAYRSRIAPHASVGYTANGSSILASSTQTGNAHLPNSLDYAIGADISVSKSLGVVADFLGQTFFSANRIYSGSRNGSPDISCDPTGASQVCKAVNFNTNSFALGAKYRPFKSFLVSGNVLFKLDDNGLHYKPSPMIGISYTF